MRCRNSGEKLGEKRVLGFCVVEIRELKKGEGRIRVRRNESVHEST
jgi:hypothetical protein